MTGLNEDEQNRKGEVNRIHLLKGSEAVKGITRKMSKRVAFQGEAAEEPDNAYHKLRKQTQVQLIPEVYEKGPALSRQQLWKRHDFE
jgi:D-lyxose ketol-isomerase